ncbi:MAG: hypothetical protein WC429_15130, partial [Verrucomicrobiia bacterium]
ATFNSGVLVLVVVFATTVSALVARYVPNRAMRLCTGSGLVVLAAVFSELSLILTVLIAALGGAIIAFGVKTKRPDGETTTGKA